MAIDSLLPLRSLVAHGAELDAMLAALPTPALFAVRGRAAGQYYATPCPELLAACNRHLDLRAQPQLNPSLPWPQRS
jgi:hypothetical protein